MAICVLDGIVYASVELGPRFLSAFLARKTAPLLEEQLLSSKIFNAFSQPVVLEK